MMCWARVALLSLVACGLGASPPQPTRAVGDWCSPVVVRPDQRCNPQGRPIWNDRAIAENASVVLTGTARDVTAPLLTPQTHSCFGPMTHARQRARNEKIRSLAAARGRSIDFVHFQRFDLVSPDFAALDGFDADFLLSTDRPWSEVEDFFRKDSSPACGRRSCRLEDPVREPMGMGLRGLIDLGGQPGRSQSVVYYLERSRVGMRVHSITAAIADQDDAQYRAWRVAEARRALVAGGYDAVDLNHKFHQYKPNEGRRKNLGHWIGAPKARDVAALNEVGDTLWTAPPAGYGYPEYVRGWAALAKDLRAAGVPYTVILPPHVFSGSGYDDPATSDVDEAALIVRAAEGARAVLLQRRPRFDAERFDRIVSDLTGAGTRVIPIDTSCGLRTAGG